MARNKVNAGRDELVKLAETVTKGTHDEFVKVEDAIAAERRVTLFSLDELKEREIKRYLYWTSLPWSVGEKIDSSPNLEALWDAHKGHPIRYVPYGNLNADLFIVGDAPGEGAEDDGKRLHRHWVQGPSSWLLRAALLKLKVLHRCWFTNLVDSPLPNNRPSNEHEVYRNYETLVDDLKAIKPRRVLMLGNHVTSFLDQEFISVGAIPLYHPGYALRKGWTHHQYAEYIKGELK